MLSARIDIITKEKLNERLAMGLVHVINSLIRLLNRTRTRTGSHGICLKNILELICNEAVEFYLRLDHGLKQDVREWLTGSHNVNMNSTYNAELALLMDIVYKINKILIYLLFHSFLMLRKGGMI